MFDFSTGIIVGLMGGWQLCKLLKEHRQYHKVTKDTDNFIVKEMPKLKLFSCPRCGGKRICSGMGNSGVEWSCINPSCI